MKQFLMFWRRRDGELEAALRAGRPKPSAQLMRSIAYRIDPKLVQPIRTRSRVAVFAAVTATMCAVLGATGGFSAAASSVVAAGKSVAHVAGVTHSSGISPHSSAGVYDSAPEIFGFSPLSGKVGTSVTVSGANFTGDNAITDVTLNGEEVNFSVTSTTSLSFTVPSDGTTGTISVSNAFGTATSSSVFAVNAKTGAPTVTGFSPGSGVAGTTVSITGTNFTGFTGVSFNGASAAGCSTSDGKHITGCIVPGGATTGPITVYTGNGAGSSKASFIVLDGASIDSFSPAYGPVGTPVTITGSGFTGSTGADFNGTAVASKDFKVKNDSTITVKVPTGATNGPITVHNPNGDDTSSSDFTVNAKTGAPKVMKFSPTAGTTGFSPVAITGTGFTGMTEVDFNGVAATGCSVASDKSITGCAVPFSATTGPITVVTPLGAGASKSSFIVDRTPLIDGFSPSSGPKGTSVTITGENLEGATEVDFNGTPQKGAVVKTTKNGVTTIKVTVAAGSTTGPITVKVGSGISAETGDVFTVINTKPDPFTFSPGSGHAGQTVTLTGGNFTGATSVKLGSASVVYRVVNDTTITFTIPSGLKAGSVGISVANKLGTRPSATKFTITT